MRRPQTQKVKPCFKRHVAAGLVLLLLVSMNAGCALFPKRIPVKPAPQAFTFPKDFLWGAATSAHQVEGNNTNNDWWDWEQSYPFEERSGRASDHWNRFDKDFQLAHALGHNVHRFSIEWSRIEPREGEFDLSAINHYRQVILSLKSKGIKPIVTLNHFTLPLWLARQGGWLSDQTPELFGRYVQTVTEALGSEVHYWITLNEPMAYAFHGYMNGKWPPGIKSLPKAVIVLKHLLEGHVSAYGKIKAVYVQKGWPLPMVGIAHQVLIFAPCTESAWGDRFSAKLRNRLVNHLFIQAMVHGKAHFFGLFRVQLDKPRTLDFIGLNYYTREFVSTHGMQLSEMMGEECAEKHPRNVGQRNFLGWETYPEGLYTLLKDFSGYKLPILISENGTCANQDGERTDFIAQHIKAMARAMREGAPVMGYLYWSLIDTYEWGEGFGPRFGLIEVNYKTQERKIRESAKKYSEIIRSGKISA
ncbi:MAG: hypothetical protein COV74_00915 [Candidatus Omnitrophica bacterium CG11_big_fil_rev_8_21_14_0_20_45_26]|uniref:Beta-glucosidase n=1 Tax=Candidatus Abzuiibacterium crystallinum TaxID=1974748 RepID=A0A2H0LV66_9BACT|nr:MAG: hypothetical protein COV74_00915 [Candidatus Omnitrophica bacterium CG11_big_fil_rev_8_21_14_0_20_45_26]PIW64404.1 MAG: hypothetical protein COW12_06325 [Candidatus Omnitrophica bacterium CG12_big_fil_rev_8_21_14_0_65_45_16]